VRWHDGTPLSVDDILFSYQVGIDPDVPYKSRRALNQIDEIQAIDQHTFAIRWKSVFGPGGRLNERDFFVIPRHVLAATFESDRNAFVNSAFWNTEFIGTGPYRIVDWLPGSEVRVEPFPGFYGEQPKISTIIFRTIPDINTAVANIRAGEVDVWLGSSLGIELAQDLKTSWENAGQGKILTSPRLIFEIRFGADDPKVSDVRVRKAFYHSMDREAIVQDLYFGLLQVAHTYVPPGSSGFDQVDARITKYPHDPNRAQQLLNEVGWQKGSDGMLRNQRGEEYTLPFATTSGVNEREQLQTVIANMWKAAGFGIVIENVPSAVQRDPSYRFPTLDLSGIGADFEANMVRLDGRNLRSPQNPRGANVWGYSNDEVDGLLDRWVSTLDRREQIAIEAAVMHRVSEDLPILPINYRIEANPVAQGVQGVPTRGPKAGATNTWNVETWIKS
jgi:peptide/nickel transport system substrate-binding protein